MNTLITNVTVIDGLGNPPFCGDVLICGNRIKDVSAYPLSRKDSNIIDGTGQFLCPGFIDCHSHYDLANFLENGMHDKVMQGITTEVIGVCGLGVAPVKKCDQQEFRNNLIIGDVDVQWNWETYAEFFESLRQTKLEHNLVPFAGHGVLRYFIKKNDSACLSSIEIELLKSELSKCFEAGAHGVSLGLIYLPAVYSNREELKTTFEVAKKYNRLVMVHLRSESDEIIEALKEIIEIAGDYISMLHISHLKIIGQRNAQKLADIFKLIEQNEIQFDHYPFNYGSTTMLSIIPPSFFEGKTLDAALKSFANTNVRKEITACFNETTLMRSGASWDNIPALVGWDNITISDIGINTGLIGMNISDAAKQQGVEPAVFALDLLEREQGNVRMIDTYMNESLVEQIFLHEKSMIGTDSLMGGVKHPRCYGTFPKIIEEFVFNKKIISIEHAIKKMTSTPAIRLGLKDRGVIRPGAYADLVMFGDDFHLPLSHTESTGLTFLWVNGELKVEEGIYLSKRKGIIIKPVH